VTGTIDGTVHFRLKGFERTGVAEKQGKVRKQALASFVASQHLALK